SDDVTREGFADALGLAMSLDEEVLEGIRLRFERRGLTMADVNRKQALVPEGAEVLANDVGTAPGLWIRVGAARSEGKAKDVVLLPGPPRELQPIFESQVLPRLAERARGIVFRTKQLFIAGLPESSVEQAVGPIYGEYDNPSTTILASPGQVEIRLTARASTATEADAANEELASKLREVLGTKIFSEEGEPLEEVVGRLLSERSLSLAVAESCTGGLIAHRLTEIPGSSRYVERGFVTYSNESKVELLDVPDDLIRTHGAVSEEVAESMAEGARKRAGTDLAVAVTGIAGPGGGSPQKPVGLVFIAVCDERGSVVRRLQIPGGRSQVKWWSSQAALNLLRLHVLKQD
ncbi:MAG: CinA family nicotinamide mononucleotide deamidase-related protein, partial [Vicinamibacteria bacterium]